MMKNLFILALTTFLLNQSFNLQAQINNNPFVGNWQWQNGSQIFRVDLGLNDKGDIIGNFILLESNLGIITDTIYKSKKSIAYESGLVSAILGSNNGTNFSGLIKDNSIANQQPLYGELKMIIQTNNPGSTTATWRVKRGQGLKLSTDNRTFTIPTDIVLTKVQ